MVGTSIFFGSCCMAIDVWCHLRRRRSNCRKRLQVWAVCRTIRLESPKLLVCTVDMPCPGPDGPSEFLSEHASLDV